MKRAESRMWTRRLTYLGAEVCLTERERRQVGPDFGSGSGSGSASDSHQAPEPLRGAAWFVCPCLEMAEQGERQWYDETMWDQMFSFETIRWSVVGCIMCTATCGGTRYTGIGIFTRLAQSDFGL